MPNIAKLTRLLKLGIRGMKKPKLSEEAVEHVKAPSMAEGTPARKFISDEKNLEHEEMLKKMERGNEGVEEAPVQKVVEEEATVEVEPEMKEATVQAYRKKYNITPGDARKKKPSVKEVEATVKSTDPNEIRKMRETLPELSDQSDETVSAVYRYLSKMNGR